LETSDRDAVAGKDAVSTAQISWQSKPSASPDQGRDAARNQPSMNEIRQRAREDWLKNYYYKDSADQAVPKVTSDQEVRQKKGMEESQEKSDKSLDPESE
jgi:hypothetical protein